MSGEQKILYNLSKTLKHISENAIAGSFTGLGIVVCDETFNHGKYHSGMGIEPCPKEDMYLGERKTADFLLELSDELNPSHDGFNFFGDDLKLTHISQYLGAPVVEGANIDKPYGAGSRFHTAWYGACLDGVKAIGTISSKGGYFIFEKLLKENGIDIKVRGSEEIKNYLKAFESVCEKIEVTYKSPIMKQIAMYLLLLHIFKNPFNMHMIPLHPVTLGVNNIVA